MIKRDCDHPSCIIYHAFSDAIEALDTATAQVLTEALKEGQVTDEEAGKFASIQFGLLEGLATVRDIIVENEKYLDTAGQADDLKPEDFES